MSVLKKPVNDISASDVKRDFAAETKQAEAVERWKVENAEAIEEANRFIEQNGLPLGGLRRH